MQNSQEMRELTAEELGMVAGGLDLSGVGGSLTGVAGELGLTVSLVGNYLGAAVGSLLAGTSNAVGYGVASLVSALSGILGGL